jgi:hypothetical protein
VFYRVDQVEGHQRIGEQRFPAPEFGYAGDSGEGFNLLPGAARGGLPGRGAQQPGLAAGINGVRQEDDAFGTEDLGGEAEGIGFRGGLRGEVAMNGAGKANMAAISVPATGPTASVG